MKRLANILGLALAVAATFAACGAAASLALGSQPLSAGNASVGSCGVSSLTATRDVSNAGIVTQVNVAGIPAACAGETLSITLVGAGNSALASSSTTLTGCAATCTATFTSLGASINATSLLGYSFGLTGS
ncbi:MAG TPA: hypothetical protein VFA56_14760 [Gaiellaceae bacterium]|nr:hypothetical protein [Gaiellaceae bacterium]